MLPFQLHTSVWSLFKTNGFNRDSEKCPNFCIVSKLTFVIWGLNQMLIKGSPSMQKGNTSLCKSRQRQSWSNNQIFLVIIKGAKSHTHTHTLYVALFSVVQVYFEPEEAEALKQCLHINLCLWSFPLLLTPALDGRCIILLTPLRISAPSIWCAHSVWFFVCLVKSSVSPAREVQEALVSPDNTYFNILCVDSMWTQPLTLPLSLSLGPALALPLILLGTRWTVNFASPPRPGDQPRTQTSQETGTQDRKLLLITSHASGCSVLWKADMVAI